MVLGAGVTDTLGHAKGYEVVDAVRLSCLVWVELDKLVVVCLGESKQGGGHAAVCPRLCDVPHAKEEPHLTHHLHCSVHRLGSPNASHTTLSETHM